MKITEIKNKLATDVYEMGLKVRVKLSIHSPHEVPRIVKDDYHVC